MDAKYKILAINDTEQTITIEYYSHVDGSSIARTYHLPVDERGEILDKQDIIEFINSNYPRQDFELKNKEIVERNIKKIQDFNIPMEGQVEYDKPVDNSSSVEKYNINSAYGSDYDVKIIKHIVLEVLKDLNIIK